MIRFLPPAPPVDETVAQTPPDRDRLIDAVRALAIIIVVIGHGFVAIVTWRSGVPRAGNVLAGYPTGQLLTWVFQVMPLFFFAGGYANAASWGHRGSRSYAEWMWARTRRLLRPLWGYLLVMIPVAVVTGAAAPAKVSSPIVIIATQLLWFLGIYLIITAMTPLLAYLEARHEGVLIAGLVAFIALIDLARFHVVGGPVALLNFIFVWALLATVGMRYRRGMLSSRAGLGLAITAVMINVVMVLVLEWYPRSMVGMPGDRFSNVAPPTLALTMHGIVVIGVITWLAGPIRRLMEHARVWRITVLINIVMMTIYLWHLPALMLLFLVERGIGVERPATLVDGIGPAPAAGFWVASIGHWIAFIGVVLMAVRILWPLEYLRIPIWDRPTTAAPPGARLLTITGSVMAGSGLLMLSATGLTMTGTISYLGVPLNAAAALGLVVLGAGLIKWAGARSTTQDDWSS